MLKDPELFRKYKSILDEIQIGKEANIVYMEHFKGMLSTTFKSLVFYDNIHTKHKNIILNNTEYTCEIISGSEGLAIYLSNHDTLTLKNIEEILDNLYINGRKIEQHFPIKMTLATKGLRSSIELESPKFNLYYHYIDYPEHIMKERGENLHYNEIALHTITHLICD